jgi:hypothetical protein
MGRRLTSAFLLHRLRSKPLQAKLKKRRPYFLLVPSRDGNSPAADAATGERSATRCLFQTFPASMIGETTQAAKLDSAVPSRPRALAASDDAAPWWPRFGWIDGHRPIDPGTIPLRACAREAVWSSHKRDHKQAAAVAVHSLFQASPQGGQQHAFTVIRLRKRLAVSG